MMDEPLAKNLKELYKKRPWLKERIESDEILKKAFEELENKKNYEHVINKIDLNDLPLWVVKKIYKFYKENKLQQLNLDEIDFIS
jgi:hypothetical protein